MKAVTTNFTIQQSPFSVAILDDKGRILNHSETFAEEIGMEEDLKGKDYYALVPEIPEKFKSIDQSYFQGAKTKTEVHRFVCKEKKIKWYKWKLSYWTTDANEYGGLILVHEDITEIHRNEELLNRAMDVARIGGWELDMINNTLYWSKVTKEIHEVPYDYIPDLEKAINFYKEGADRDNLTELLSEVIANGTSAQAEVRIITGKGREKWVHAKGEAEVIHGKCVRVYGTFQDIDSRKRMEEQNTSFSERLAIATKSAHIGIWEYNLVKNKLDWSDEMYLLYGIHKSDFEEVNEAWEACLHPEDKERVREEGLQLASQGATDFDTVFRINWPGGEIRNIRSKGYIERDEEGNALRMIGANWDITESINSEKRLKDLLSITTEQNDSLMNFAHIVSHNLRSHSSNLSMLTSFLNTEKDDRERERLVNMLLEASEALDETVGHLTEVVQLKTEAADKIKKLNLLDVLKAVQKNVSVMMEEEQVNPEIKVSPEIMIKAIPAYLDSIFLNLFTNSLKYKSPDRPLELKIEARVKGDRVLVTFQDNGQGIDMERHGSKIFGMYKTFHTHKDAKGIGLFITKNQIEAMNGKIEVESTVGEGTTFHLTFKKA